MPVKNGSVIRLDLTDRSTHGWQGRVYWRGRRGRLRAYTKFYADRKYGGVRKAWLRAARWVRAKERQLGKPHTKSFAYPRHLTTRCYIDGSYLINAAPGYRTWCPKCYRNR